MFPMIVCILFKVVIADQVTSTMLIEKAVFVTNKFYRHELVTSVVWTSKCTAEANEYLTKYSGSVMTIPLNINDTTFILKAKEDLALTQTIFFTDRSNAFKTFMEIINQNLRFPIRLVLVVKGNLEDPTSLQTFNEIAWNNNLVDIVIISVDDKDKIILSTYFPYKDGVCGNNQPVIFKTNENMFPKKCTNFNFCPFKTSVVNFMPYARINIVDGINEVVGYDGVIVKVISHTLNATLQIQEATDHVGYGSYHNGTATGAFADLVYKKADFLIPAGILTEKRYLGSQISHIYRTVAICWVAPKPREIASLVKILLPFYNTTTPCLCLAFILFVIVAILIRRQGVSRKKKKPNVCFQTFTLLLGQTANYMTRVPLLNNVFMLWIWFCFIIRIDYQGSLVETLQNKILEAPFATLDEAVEKLDGFGSIEVFLTYYLGTHLEHDYKILSLAEFKTCLKSVVEGERFLLAANIDMVKHVRRSVQILGSQISSSSCFYMQPGWPAAQYVNTVFLRMVEAGIIEKILSEDQKVRATQETEDGATNPLDMMILGACFYGLVIMSVVSTIVFIIEVVYHKVSVRKRNNFTQRNETNEITSSC